MNWTVDAEKLQFRLVQKSGAGQSTENLHRDWNSEREHIKGTALPLTTAREVVALPQ